MKNKLWTEQDLIEAVKTSESIAETLRKLGLKPQGSNYKTIHKYVHLLSLDTSHWLGLSHLKGKRRDVKSTPLEDILIDNCHFSTGELKKKLIKSKTFDYVCAKCNIHTWNGEHIVLHLDHINGKNTDNRIENLRFLCPNCHSQTTTYCGKNNSNKL